MLIFIFLGLLGGALDVGTYLSLAFIDGPDRLMQIFRIEDVPMTVFFSVFCPSGRRSEAVWSDDLQLMWDGVQRRQPRGQFPTHPVPPALPRVHQICGKTSFSLSDISSM